MLRIIIILIFLFHLSLTTTIITTNNKTLSNKIGSIQINRINYKRCGEIIIGNQKYNIAFNLGSTDFWVVNDELSSFKLLNKTGNIKDAGTKGSLVKDTLIIGDITIKNISFVVVPTIPAAFVNNFKTDGVLGLSSTSDMNINSPIQYLTKYIENPIFTIFTKSNGELALPSQNGKNVGKITFGAEDNDNCESYNYVPLSERPNLIVNIQCAKIGDSPLYSIISNNNNNKMTILEEELFMLAPPKVLNEMAKIMNLTSQGDDTGIYLFKEGSCNKNNINKLPIITLTVGDKNDCEKQANINIYPKQYLQYTALGDCRLLIADSVMMGYDNGWFMGAQFFENRCIAMNWKDGTIGFADAKN